MVVAVDICIRKYESEQTPKSTIVDVCIVHVYIYFHMQSHRSKLCMPCELNINQPQHSQYHALLRVCLAIATHARRVSATSVMLSLCFCGGGNVTKWWCCRHKVECLQQRNIGRCQLCQQSQGLEGLTWSWVGEDLT